jgi:hypothetical protein
MKNLTIARALLPLLLTAPLVAGQATTATAGQTAAPTDDGRVVDRVIAARSQYTLDSSSLEGNDTTLAQLPRRPLVFHRGSGYPPPAYPSMWASGGHGHPVAGALIGFCLGAVIAAGANADKGGRVAAAFGGASIGALLGAAVGHSASVFRVRRPCRGISWPDPDQAARAPHRGRSPQQAASANSAPPDVAASVDAPSQPSSEAP